MPTGTRRRPADISDNRLASTSRSLRRRVDEAAVAEQGNTFAIQATHVQCDHLVDRRAVDDEPPDRCHGGHRLIRIRAAERIKHDSRLEGRTDSASVL